MNVRLQTDTIVEHGQSKPVFYVLPASRSIQPPVQTGVAQSNADRTANGLPDCGGIALRPFRREDAPALHQATIESLGDLCQTMTWCRHDYTLADTQLFISRSLESWNAGDCYNCAIVDAADTELLGCISLNHINRRHGHANIAYWVRRSSSGRGVASIAARLVARFGLFELGLHRLEILVANNNLASQRVAQKAGARFEGILRHRLMLCGQLHDAVVFSFVAADFHDDR